MKTVTIHEAKTHFSKLIDEALGGEEIIVARGKIPVIRLTPLAEGRPERVPGGSRGLIRRMAQDFDQPVDEFTDAFQ